MKKSVRFLLEFGFASAFTLVLAISIGIRAEAHFGAGDMWPAVGLTVAALCVAALNAAFSSMLAAGLTHVFRDYLDDIVYEPGWDVDETG